MSRFTKNLSAVVAAVVLCTFALPASGQTSRELERIREERRQVQEERSAKAAAIDATSAEIDELAEALEILIGDVTAKELRVADSERSLKTIRANLKISRENVTLMEAEIREAEERLATRAVASWLNQSNEPPLLVDSVDPTQASRMQKLVGTVTGTEADMADSLRELKEDLEIERARARAANTEANTIQARLRIELAGLEQAKADAEALAIAAEERFEHLLSEKQNLDAIDSQLAMEYDVETERIRDVLKRAAIEGKPIVALTDPSEILKAEGANIYVHASIVDQLSSLLAAAKADGIILGGGGYRDSAKQVQLRMAHCGTSDYGIWEKPASLCSPPTARPGLSLHERGLAIDFTYNGRGISSHSNKAYKWLAANAADFGFYNLPSEPWHWSTTGA